jgi:Brp/Blh family beta-carotene 15,15'-monooxygenase
MITFTGAAILWMLVAKRLQEAIDLALLLTLVLAAPPLVAFAFYFGLWHALRHTGRVSLELDSSKSEHAAGDSWGAFGKAVWAGVPALVLVIGFTIFLGLTQGFNLSQELLWYLLVVIWALTVPHMALTLRLDVRALRG